MPSEDEDTGHKGDVGGGKQVKISIREKLLSFRRNAAPIHTTTPTVQSNPSILIPVYNKASNSFTTKLQPEPESNLDADADDIIDTQVSKEILHQSDHEDEGGNQGTDSEREKGESRVESQENKGENNVIRPIDRGVVHQICSGQVIVTLSTAVKELVENSLDAGAKKIDIRLQEYGSKLIEVCDDGNGIDESNFEGLALKHHTSKISEFEDLVGVTTFGFRGEALSSLCALSNLSVTTRHKSSEVKMGCRLAFDHNGRITSRSNCARERGTTVTLKDLFHTLPVRHREFMKNLKREFHRMVNILYGYCLVVNGTRISCTNQVGNSGPTKVVSVPSYTTMKERIVALFGSKQYSSLVEIKQCESVPEEILSEFGLTEKTFERKYEIEGYISMPNHGRSSSDRQFFFINSRPCDPVKISRVINEVYHSFSRQQNPFVCLHIKTKREDVDVNVTPDKRTLYVQNEKILLAILKASLGPILTSAASSYNPMSSQLSSQHKFTFNSQSQPDDNDDDDNGFTDLSSSASLCLNDFQGSQKTMDNSFSQEIQQSFDRQYSGSGQVKQTSQSNRRCRTDDFLNKLRTSSCTSKRQRPWESNSTPRNSKTPKLTGYLQKYEVREKTCIASMHSKKCESDTSEEESCNASASDFFHCQEKLSASCDKNVNDKQEVEILYDDDSSEVCSGELTNSQRQTTVSIDWQGLSSKIASMKMKNEGSQSSAISYARRFRAKISPEDNTTAEDELQKQLTQDSFSQMEILGQFNLGFIIVKSGPDLFIVDQHASDEKFNFEDLQNTTIMQSQPLISPLDLQLPAISENIIMDKIEVFQKNGFDFIISPDEEPTKRVRLSSIPYSKNTQFGKSDVEELVFMMEDASDKSFYRPTKVREMLASRACRKSVMIGKALSAKEMRLIVDNMGKMDQPWNCPHGRPTIRHLINLNLLPDLDQTKFAH